jgi:hypothetical protein
MLLLCACVMYVLLVCWFILLCCSEGVARQDRNTEVEAGYCSIMLRTVPSLNYLPNCRG